MTEIQHPAFPDLTPEKLQAVLDFAATTLSAMNALEVWEAENPHMDGSLELIQRLNDCLITIDAQKDHLEDVLYAADADPLRFALVSRSRLSTEKEDTVLYVCDTQAEAEKHLRKIAGNEAIYATLNSNLSVTYNKTNARQCYTARHSAVDSDGVQTDYYVVPMRKSH